MLKPPTSLLYSIQALQSAFEKFSSLGQAILVADGGDSLLGAITGVIDQAQSLLGQATSTEHVMAQILEEVVRNVKCDHRLTVLR